MIIGAGSIGLCCLAVAKAMGMRRIVVVATTSARLEIAKKLGAYATVATREEDLFEENDTSVKDSVSTEDDAQSESDTAAPEVSTGAQATSSL